MTAVKVSHNELITAHFVTKLFISKNFRKATAVTAHPDLQTHAFMSAYTENPVSAIKNMHEMIFDTWVLPDIH